MKKFCLVLILSFLIPAQAHAIKYQGELESNESVTFPEQGSTPASPPTGKKRSMSNQMVCTFWIARGSINF